MGALAASHQIALQGPLCLPLVPQIEFSQSSLEFSGVLWSSLEFPLALSGFNNLGGQAETFCRLCDDCLGAVDDCVGVISLNLDRGSC